MNSHFTPFHDENIRHLFRLFEAGGKIVITTHSRPDGDAAGSSLALWHYLHSIGQDATVILPDPLDDYLNWLPGAKFVLTASLQPEAVKQAISEAALVFCLDYGVISRTGDFVSSQVYASKAPRVLLDHHIWPEDAYSVSFHDVKASSTCELVFRLIHDLGDAEKITKEIAECLYTGIVTDTGSFRFDTTTPALHRAAGFLIEKGLEPAKVHIRLFDNFSENRLRFLGYCLDRKMRVLPEYKTSYMVISRSEMEKFQVNDGDTEGLVNYNLSMSGINLGVLIIERKDKVKLSFRSKGEFPCNILAGHFSGGGHHNASGGQSNESLEQTEQTFLEVLKTFRDRLLY